MKINKTYLNNNNWSKVENLSIISWTKGGITLLQVDDTIHDQNEYYYNGKCIVSILHLEALELAFSGYEVSMSYMAEKMGTITDNAMKDVYGIVPLKLEYKNENDVESIYYRFNKNENNSAIEQRFSNEGISDNSVYLGYGVSKLYLNRNEVAQLLPILINFVKKGSIK